MRAPDAVWALGVPVLGICYGMQAMAVQLGGEVETIDFMTARWAHLPYEPLDVCSRRIINEVPGLARVVYDVSGDDRVGVTGAGRQRRVLVGIRSGASRSRS